MGVPDPRPRGVFGPFALYTKRDIFETHYSDTGGVISAIQYSDERQFHGSIRNNPSTNRRRALSGTATLWIPPSSYTRIVQQHRPLQKGTYLIFGRGSSGRYLQWKTVYGFDPALSAVYPEWKDWRTAGYQYPGLLIPENEVARLVTECLLNLKDQKVNLGENLATLKQTVNLFAKNGITLLKSLRAARVGNWKNAFGYLGLRPTGRPVGLGLAQRYLEYNYGLKPLVQDIYGGYELMKQQLKPALLIHARRTLRNVGDREVEVVDVSKSLRMKFTDHASRFSRMQLTGRLSNEYARTISQAGLSNPLSLAWDLMPWSFVIDWSTPIGSVLSALDAARGLEFVGGHRTHKVDVTTVASIKNFEFYTDTQVTQPYMHTTFTSGVVREKYSSWPAPQFYAKSPLSSSHVVTALALFRQLF